VSLGAGRAARPLKGERGVGGKCPNAGVPSPGAGEPNVAAVAGVRSAPVGALAAGGKKPGESPRPAGEPGKLLGPVPPDGERAESGGGAAAGE